MLHQVGVSFDSRIPFTLLKTTAVEWLKSVMLTRICKLYEGDIEPVKMSTSEIVVDTLGRSWSLVSKLSGLSANPL